MKGKKRLVSLLLSAALVAASGIVPASATEQESVSEGRTGAVEAEVRTKAEVSLESLSGNDAGEEDVTIVAEGTEGKNDTIHWTIDSNGLLTVSGNGVPDKNLIPSSEDQEESCRTQWCEESYRNLIKTAYVNLTVESWAWFYHPLFDRCEKLESVIFDCTNVGFEIWAFECGNLKRVEIRTDTMRGIELPFLEKNQHTPGWMETAVLSIIQHTELRQSMIIRTGQNPDYPEKGMD